MIGREKPWDGLSGMGVMFGAISGAITFWWLVSLVGYRVPQTTVDRDPDGIINTITIRFVEDSE